MTSTTVTPQALEALAKETGFEFDAERLDAVTGTLAFIRSVIGKLDELDMSDDSLSQPFNVDWS
ncbi:hypothetical protein [Cupriavidus necator]|uniref:hypothetical protein n=1 Tax=Cupriavidus necator TaxID=106590 RepID=UPI00339D4A60